MIARRSIAAMMLVASLAAPAFAAPRFSAVPDDFVGTAFRGVSLGQNRAEVEAALAANGFRCLTTKEYPYDVVQTAGYTACNIVRADFIVDASTEMGLMVRYTFDQGLGMPYFGVMFANGVASAITLDQDYFNASSTTPHAFAQQFVESYPTSDGLSSYGSGWQGATPSREHIIIHSYLNGRAALLIVTAMTDQTTPTFD